MLLWAGVCYLAARFDTDEVVVQDEGLYERAVSGRGDFLSKSSALSTIIKIVDA